MSSEAENAPDQEQGLGLGTFLGVYTPTVLTILGVILYLRMGWVVGNAGIGGALLIVIIAHVITITTSLSLSSLSTSMKVGVGGAYYIISRSLGLELGGALGIPLYLSQVLSVTLYAFGLAEAGLFVFGLGEAPAIYTQLIAGIIIVAVTALAARSTVLALKAQLPILAFIAASLIALLAGVDWNATLPAVPEDFSPEPFWGVFAVFFPAVTGVMAGLGLSGDLRDPGRSIPIGVLAAVGTGFLVYFAAPIVLGNAAGVEALVDDKLIWTHIAVGGKWFILPGLFGAVLSSAIGSILGAPRTLQALAQDGLLPERFGRLDPNTGEPMLALQISGGFALAAVLLGDLNAVAEVVSMFFLTTYGMLNLSAALESWVKDPSFRPRLKVHFGISFIGALGCFLVMALINPMAFLVAVTVELGLWYWLSRRQLEATWGDLRSGFWFATVRVALMRLRVSRLDPRNWRPHILVFSEDVSADVDVVRLAANLTQERGIITVATIVEGRLDELKRAKALRERNAQVLDDAGVLAFPEVLVVEDLEQGIMASAQANGYAGLDSNVAVLGWPREYAHLSRMMRWIHHLDALEKSTVLMRLQPPPERPPEEILVWWKGREHNGDLMLLLAHMLSYSPAWRQATIVLARVVSDTREAEAFKQQTQRAIVEINIDANVETIVQPNPDGVVEAIRIRSRNADLIFFGISLPQPGEEEAAAERLDTLSRELPSAVFVRNSSPFRGRLV